MNNYISKIEYYVREVVRITKNIYNNIPVPRDRDSVIVNGLLFIALWLVALSVSTMLSFVALLLIVSVAVKQATQLTRADDLLVGRYYNIIGISIGLMIVVSALVYLGSSGSQDTPQEAPERPVMNEVEKVEPTLVENGYEVGEARGKPAVFLTEEEKNQKEQERVERERTWIEEDMLKLNQDAEEWAVRVDKTTATLDRIVEDVDALTTEIVFWTSVYTDTPEWYEEADRLRDRSNSLMGSYDRTNEKVNLLKQEYKGFIDRAKALLKRAQKEGFADLEALLEVVVSNLEQNIHA